MGMVRRGRGIIGEEVVLREVGLRHVVSKNVMIGTGTAGEVLKNKMVWYSIVM